MESKQKNSMRMAAVAEFEMAVVQTKQQNAVLRVSEELPEQQRANVLRSKLRRVEAQIVKITTKEGVINCFGEQVFPYIDNVTFGRGFVSAEDYNISRYGVMSEDGKIVIPLEFNAIRRYGDVYMVRHITTGRYGLYSLVGDVVLPCEYELMDIGDTLDYIAVRKDGEWYYVNRRGERVLL